MHPTIATSKDLIAPDLSIADAASLFLDQESPKSTEGTEEQGELPEVEESAQGISADPSDAEYKPEEEEEEGELEEGEERLDQAAVSPPVTRSMSLPPTDKVDIEAPESSRSLVPPAPAQPVIVTKAGHAIQKIVFDVPAALEPAASSSTTSTPAHRKTKAVKAKEKPAVTADIPKLPTRTSAATKRATGVPGGVARTAFSAIVGDSGRGGGRVGRGRGRGRNVGAAPSQQQ